MYTQYLNNIKLLKHFKDKYSYSKIFKKNDNSYLDIL